tara:strand:- start:35246 stop:35458 length:213 start_codon:yes stop_codon:yes gene_type:complete
MKVKATSSYKDLEAKDNPLIEGSPLKHKNLMEGKTIEITVVPKQLESHLVNPYENKVETKTKTKTKKENK